MVVEKNSQTEMQTAFVEQGSSAGRPKVKFDHMHSSSLMWCVRIIFGICSYFKLVVDIGGIVEQNRR